MKLLLIGSACVLAFMAPPESDSAPQSAKVKAARTDFDKELSDAKALFDQKATEAKQRYVDKLDGALKDALRAENLAEANRIAALKKTLEPDTAAINGGESAKGRDPNIVHLSDMEHFNVHAHNGFFGKSGVLNSSGAKIYVNKVYAATGISLHPYSNGHSSVEFRPLGIFKVFRTKVAIADNATRKAATSITFHVKGDGKLLWSSGAIAGPGRVETCQVNIANVKVLELRVECPGPADFAQAVWTQPVLTK